MFGWIEVHVQAKMVRMQLEIMLYNVRCPLQVQNKHRAHATLFGRSMNETMPPRFGVLPTPVATRDYLADSETPKIFTRRLAYDNTTWIRPFSNGLKFHSF